MNILDLLSQVLKERVVQVVIGVVVMVFMMFWGGAQLYHMGLVSKHVSTTISGMGLIVGIAGSLLVVALAAIISVIMPWYEPHQGGSKDLDER